MYDATSIAEGYINMQMGDFSGTVVGRSPARLGLVGAWLRALRLSNMEL